MEKKSWKTANGFCTWGGRSREGSEGGKEKGLRGVRGRGSSPR